MSNDKSTNRFVPTSTAAMRLGIPKKWLRDEARAGRVPFLIAGRRLLFDVDAVAAELTARSAGEIVRERSLTLEEAARWLHVSPRDLEAEASTGSLPATQRDGRFMFDRDKLSAAFLERARRESGGRRG